MGPLRRALLAAALLAAPARAAEPQAWVVPVDGTPRPGDIATLEVAVADATGAPWDGPPPRVAMSAGEIVEEPVAVGPGRWHARWLVPFQVPSVQGLTARVAIDDRSLERLVAVRPPAATALQLPARVEGRAGQQEPVRVLVSGTDLPPPELLQVAAGEGEVVGVEALDAGMVVLWQPPDDPLPRAVPLAVRDGRGPGTPPAWTTVRLAGEPRVPISTDPGARVALEVGGRSYGPVVAGPDGQAIVRAEVWPGEATALVTVEDELGNQRRSTLTLGGVSAPSLLLLAESPVVPGQALPVVHVGAFRVDGRPWLGAPPTCRAGLGEALALAPVQPASWRASLPAAASRLFDVRIDCVLADQAQATLRVPVERAVPGAVRLRAWPPEVDADLPVAQVQAWLEGPTGDRLPATGLALEAEHGSLEPEPSTEALVVATYDGSAAIAHGRDTLVASWAPPAGEGGAWSIELGLAAVDPEEGLTVVALPRDRQARPLPDLPLEVVLDGAVVQARADAGGRALVTLPAAGLGPWVVSVRAGAVERRRVLFRADAGAEGLPSPELRASLDLPVRSGDVRRIFVEARPESIAAGGAEAARVVVRLEDQAGRAVTESALVIEASAGRVGRLRQAADGSYEAEYRPPARLHYGEVELTVRGEGDWSARTRLRVEPRRLRYATGLHAGWLYGSRLLSSPWVALEQDARLPLLPASFLARLSVGGYGLATTVDDDGTGRPVELSAAFVPIGLSALGRYEQGRLGSWLGAGFVLAPYQLLAVYDGEVASRGVALAAPGGDLVGGLGWRLGGGELALQVSYLLLTVPPGDVGFEGPVGGGRATLGWRFLY